MIQTTSPAERFYKFAYEPFDHQYAFHKSKAKHRLLGGAAGPGKTFAVLMDHYWRCNKFPAETAPQVHTLILRRTYPKLFDTVVTRFREKFPPETYKSFNEQKGVVTWHNGSTTKFGAMQYEHDVWGYQGQWYKIAYDELTEFTFGQWQNISAWNRCPVATDSTKDGATNPIGIGARWVEDLFVKKTPCAEMDANQRRLYNPLEHAYFAATYRDNPIYAKDETYIANLDSYQSAISKALKEGIWGVAGGYFDGAWDEAVNTYYDGMVEIKPWWIKWLGADWGFDHNSAVYWFALDECGIVRIYRELVCNKHSPEMLAERIVEMSSKDRRLDGSQEPYKFFSLSHDAFAQKQDANTTGLRMGAVLKKAGIVEPIASTKDKRGREQLLYDMLRDRVKVGERDNDAGEKVPVLLPRLQISMSCSHLIRTIPTAPRDEKNREEIAEFLGDDPLQGAGYGLYQFYGKPSLKPPQIADVEEARKISDPYERHWFMVQRQKERSNQSVIMVPQEAELWRKQ